MARGVVWVITLDIVGCLANDLEIPNHRILSFFIRQKTHFGNVICITMKALNRLNDVAEIVRHPQGIGFAQTGSASVMTCLRNFSGKARGVSTSTGILSK